MYSLSINPLAETTLAVTLVNAAGSTTAPIRSCGYSPTRKPGEVVEETIDVGLESTNPALIAATVGLIENCLEMARTWARLQTGSEVVLQAQVLSTEDIYQSRIVDGWVELGGVGANERKQGRLTARVHVTRLNYWEGTETQIKISTGSGASTLEPVTIYNHDDGGAGHENWVKLAGDDLGAMDLPGPARIEIANTLDQLGYGMRDIYIAHNARETAALQATLVTCLQGEDCNGGSGTDDGSCSNGHYQACAWSGTTETKLIDWTVDSSNYRGNLFRFLLRLRDHTDYTDLWVKLKLLGGTTVIVETPPVLVTPGDELIELPILRIPPYLSVDKDYADLVLALYVRRYTAGDHTLNVDYLYLLPAEGWRKLKQLWQPISYPAKITDYGRQGYLVSDWAAGEYTDHVGLGDPIMLLPGKTQRLYFAWDVEGGTAPIAGTAGIKVWVNKRRRNI